MERKIAVLLATVGLLLSVTSVFAVQWYFSAEQTTTSVEYVVMMDSIPSQLPRNQIYYFTGNVTLGGTLQSGLIVTLFLNGTSTGQTGTTSGAGLYSIGYNNTQPAGTTLRFKAGVYQ